MGGPAFPHWLSGGPPHHELPTAQDIQTRPMDLSSLDLEQLCTNMYMPLLEARGQGSFSRTCQGCPSLPWSDPEGGRDAERITEQEMREAPSGKCGDPWSCHTLPPPQDPAQGSFKPSTKLSKDPGRLRSAPRPTPSPASCCGQSPGQ